MSDKKQSNAEKEARLAAIKARNTSKAVEVAMGSTTPRGSTRRLHPSPNASTKNPFDSDESSAGPPPSASENPFDSNGSSAGRTPIPLTESFAEPAQDAFPVMAIAESRDIPAYGKVLSDFDKKIAGRMMEAKIQDEMRKSLKWHNDSADKIIDASLKARVIKRLQNPLYRNVLKAMSILYATSLRLTVNSTKLAAASAAAPDDEIVQDETREESNQPFFTECFQIARDLVVSAQQDYYNSVVISQIEYGGAMFELKHNKAFTQQQLDEALIEVEKTTKPDIEFMFAAMVARTLDQAEKTAVKITTAGDKEAELPVSQGLKELIASKFHFVDLSQIHSRLKNSPSAAALP